MSLRRLQILILNPFVRGQASAPLYGPADIAWLFDMANPGSIAAFWRDVSSGIVEIDARIEAELAVAVPQATMDTFSLGSRAAGIQAALTLLAAPAAGPDFGPEGTPMAIFVGNTNVNAGNIPSVLVGNGLRSISLLDLFGEHDFLCHEIGHALGFDHEYNNVIQADTGLETDYGDVASIMSARSQLSAPMPAALRGPFGGASSRIWDTAGCGLPTPTLWRWGGSYPQILPWIRRVEADAAPERIRLRAAGLPFHHDPSLIVMPAERGGYWHMIEYRRRGGWDVPAFQLAGDATGLVSVHRIRDVGVGSTISGFPKPARVVHQKYIFLPAADADWSNGMLSLRVLGHGDEWVDLLVGHWLPRLKAVDIAVTPRDEPTTRSPGRSVEVRNVGPRCTTGTYVEEVIDGRAVFDVVAASNGYGNPVFRFKVNGMSVGGWLGAGQTASAWVKTPVMATAAVSSDPTLLGSPLFEQTPGPMPRSAWLRHEVAYNALTITTQVDRLGSYPLTIRAMVSEAPGGDGFSETSETVTVVTRTIALPEQAFRDMTDCIVSNLPVPVDFGEWVVPLEDPSWAWVDDLRPLLAAGDRQLAGIALIRGVFETRQGADRGPALVRQAAAELDVDVKAIEGFAARVLDRG
jgi:hypothetical protein